jgi:hypothetical protein
MYSCPECYEYAGGLCPRCTEDEARQDANVQELPWELEQLWADAPVITAPAFITTQVYRLEEPAA